MNDSARVTFFGGASTVTGANFLFEADDTRILVDCGLEQGKGFSEDKNYEPFPYDPKSIDVLFATHAHADHIGRIPRLVREGFSGVIYSTPATRELSSVMFDDALGILAEEARKQAREPLYEKEDVAKALALWKTLPYHHLEKLSGAVSVVLKDAGHILGSAMVELTIQGKKVIFTGDLGNSPSPLLRDTEVVSDADYLIIESVYGDRNHESREARRDIFTKAVKDTIARKGTLLIPSFSIDRTQVLLYELNNLVEDGVIEPLPVFLDSPLAIAVTKIYERYNGDFNDAIKKEIAGGDNIFDFPKFSFTPRVEDSKAIIEVPNPKIVIAGSGMSGGGRVLHHEKHYLSDTNNILLLVGYQVAGTFGRRLQDGAKKVRIFNEEIPVNAEVRVLEGYSAHKDSEHLVRFVEDSQKTLKKVFVAMGEPKSSLFLVQRLRDYLGVNAVAPSAGESYELSL
jgi:metallo-beta-lactamase family protein